MAIFLVLGTSRCEYCTRAKLLLDDEDIRYIYTDLDQVWKDWRTVFDDKDIISSGLPSERKRTIPLIFRVDDDGTVLSRYTESGQKWKFIGGFDSLNDSLKSNDSLKLDDDY
jgi:glutaredoxin